MATSEKGSEFMSNKTIMICAGGTGGHMFPALALSRDLIERGYKVIMMTDARTVKYTANHPELNVQVIASGTLPGDLIGKIKGVISLARGYFQSVSVIKKYNPGIAVGFGGYPSLPPMVAAERRDIPIIIHEANAVLGKANAYLAPKAERIALSLPDFSSLEDQDAVRAIVTGNPVRSEIAALFSRGYDAPDEADQFNLTVMGGSLGAKVMADHVPHALAALPEELKVRLHVTQQCRDEDIVNVQQIYADAGITSVLKSFFDNVPEILEETHLVIARSGASTVSEIAVAGIPAIYIPYPHHADQQQKVNAQVIAKEGGAWVMEEKDLSHEILSAKIAELMNNPQDLFKAAEGARSCAKPEATRKLGNLVVALLKGWD
jgi:UDP-N-acetylglucosamine--N-acetylmuramyl-(pentapeptide) pyrophosphoryl-undecaprenol N-acetylglucosamine transferase